MDDFNGHACDLGDHLSTTIFESRIESDMAIWFNLLAPHIRDYFLEARSYAPNARFGYVPIMPRIWWTDAARKFARELDHYVVADIPRQAGFKIKKLPTRLLYEIPDQSDIFQGCKDDIMPGFLETDVTHLNYWGYECLLKEVGKPVLDYYRNMKAGNYS